MPVRLTGATTETRKHVGFGSVEYEYDYPDGLDLRPQSPLHTKLVNKILDRAQESYTHIQEKFASWTEIERTLTTYIPVGSSNISWKSRTDWKEVQGKKSEPIIVPVTYAALETLLTYFMAAFLRYPIMGYEGHGPKDIPGAKMMEILINQDIKKHFLGLALHTQWRDAFAYGYGVTAPGWKVTRGKKTVLRNAGFLSQVFGFLNTGNLIKTSEDAILYEGNDMGNIDPRRYLPDPNVAITDLKHSEHVGWADRTNYLELLTDERYDEDMFNVQYLKHLSSAKSHVVRQEKSNRERGLSTEASLNTVFPVDVIYKFVNIIPHDWELGDSEYPEKWLFAVAGDSVLITAKPLGLNHGEYPLNVCAPDSDGRSSRPVSRLEVTYGLQDSIDWLFSSHMANIKKAVNDMFIVDPSVINISDFSNPKAGGLVRIRPMYWGRDKMKQGYEQIKVVDVTKNNVIDIKVLTDMVRNAQGTTDIVQGIMRTGGERRSATEARDVRKGALSRLEKVAKIASLQSMQPLGWMFASHTQQMMTEEKWTNASDSWPGELQDQLQDNRLLIRPQDINVNYDLLPHDGSIPGGEPADMWIQLYQILATNPELSAKFDMVRIFKHIATQVGAKNVNDFVRKGGTPNVQLTPSSEVESEIQKGNIQPTPA